MYNYNNMAWYFFIIFLLLRVVIGNDNVVINTKQGSLLGVIEQSRGSRPFYSFYGIPYAEPPLGDLRFKEPQPPKSWTGVRDATISPPPCLFSEPPFSTSIGDEDCLYLNLYVPHAGYELKAVKKQSLPVIVYVFGGNFMYCHALPSRYGPHYFMDRDVILITFHYRLGVFGFLSTEDATLPGNYGLKDFVAVLKWVQENIESFNGDKNRVTVMGGSSGGVTTSLAIISPLAEGLFHRCISHSGFPFIETEPGVAKKIANIIALNVGCVGDNYSSTDLVSCLKKIPAKDLMRQINLIDSSGTYSVQITFGPVVEDESVPGAFLVDNPMKLLPRKSNIPWLFGMNSNEGGMSAIFEYYSSRISNTVANMATDYEKFIPEFLGISRSVKDPEKLKYFAQIVKKRFFGDSDIRKNAQGFAKMVTVHFFVSEFIKSMDIYKGPKYAYYYDHQNEPNFDQYYGNPTGKMGVIHGDELISMFNWSESIPPVTTGADFVVSEKVLDLWTNFVIFGNPNGNSETQVWEPVTTLKRHYLHITSEIFQMTDKVLEEDCKYLNKLREVVSN